MQDESAKPLPSPPKRFPGDGLPPIEVFPSDTSGKSSPRVLSDDENQRVNEILERAIRLHQERQKNTEPKQSQLDKIADHKPRSSVTSTTVLNTCFVLSLLLLGGNSTLSQPYNLWAGICGVMLLAGCIAYSVSIGSNKTVGELVTNALVTCIAIGGLMFMTHGDEVRDDAGGVVSEGFKTTFDQKAGAGVRAFAVLFAGAIIGVFLADRQKSAKPN